jgi:hypothetical protein
MQTYSTPSDNALANRRYQSDLALSLIESLGIDEALEVCQRNLWSGIQDIVMRERQRLATQ